MHQDVLKHLSDRSARLGFGPPPLMYPTDGFPSKTPLAPLPCQVLSNYSEKRPFLAFFGFFYQYIAYNSETAENVGGAPGYSINRKHRAIQCQSLKKFRRRETCFLGTSILADSEFRPFSLFLAPPRPCFSNLDVDCFCIH